MKLVRIVRAQWDVLAVADPRGRCQVLEFLDSLNRGNPAARFLAVLLRVYLPLEGPPKGADHCKPLGDGLFELRHQPKGPKPRVLFFYDDRCRIVCTSAFWKSEKTPRSELEASRRIREEYLRAKSDGSLDVEEG
jgi:putative component of toxin-antitoxin plasmid stabilization module